MFYRYIANDDGMDIYLFDGSVVNKYAKQGMDIYREYKHNGVAVRKLAYSKNSKAYLTEISIYYADGTVKVVADPEHGWIGV